ncbi:MAG: hypothetical protein ACLP1Q_08570 [Solirubrobacteraceae bacterium]
MTLDALTHDEEFLDRLADRVADRVAERVAERLAPRLELAHERPEGLISASDVARMTGMKRWWVYDHAGDLGAVQLGSGSRPRLGFHPARVRQYLESRTHKPPPPTPAPTDAGPIPYYLNPQRRRLRKLSKTARELLGEPPRDS